MKRVLLLLSCSCMTVAFTQIADFETPDFGVVDSAWYGQDQMFDGDTTFTQDDLVFELNYNSTWGSFSGFALSSWTDGTTPGYGNQFSAKPAAGSNSSEQYSVCYVSAFNNNRVFLQNTSSGLQFDQVDLTNTTYAYESMLNGDAFAKKFGEDTSATGVPDGSNGEDWFLLTIYGLGQDSLQTGDSVNFYLADYTFANNADDYIVDSWETVDLSGLYSNGSDIIGLDFVLSSTDTSGGFGMNTPAYFAMDNLVLSSTSNIADSQEELNFQVFPNPAKHFVNISAEAGDELKIFDLNGRMKFQKVLTQQQISLSIEHLESGIYLLQCGEKRTKLIIQ